MVLRPIFFIGGIMIAAVGILMLIPMLVDLAYNHPDWQVFAWCSALVSSSGAALALANRDPKIVITIKQTYLLTAFCWIAIAFVAALPLLFCERDLSLADAFFEAMSGITTTGSTVINGLDTLPPGVLIWRSLLQWIGGIGFVVMAVAILPMLQVGGMQLFKTESSDASEKVLPRISQVANGIAFTYLLLTFLCIATFWALGMAGFDAINHAMTTVSTGGFSTRDASFAAFTNLHGIETAATIFMLLGALPFILYIRFLQGDILPLFRDKQVRGFLLLVLLIILIVSLERIFLHNVAPLIALEQSAFNFVSIITTTGFASSDYTAWSHFAATIAFFCTFLGGCAGSTSGGFKNYRIQILFSLAKRQVMRMLRPHGVHIPSYNNRPVKEQIAESVTGFFFFYLAAMLVLAVILSFYNCDLITSISGSITAIANVGPGFGDIIGPAGNFATLPDGAKWWLSAGMLLGRLELFTILILFFPSFWRN